jgi:hypothetical protein
MSAISVTKKEKRRKKEKKKLFKNYSLQRKNQRIQKLTEPREVNALHQISIFFRDIILDVMVDNWLALWPVGRFLSLRGLLLQLSEFVALIFHLLLTTTELELPRSNLLRRLNPDEGRGMKNDDDFEEKKKKQEKKKESHQKRSLIQENTPSKAIKTRRC